MQVRLVPRVSFPDNTSITHPSQLPEWRRAAAEAQASDNWRRAATEARAQRDRRRSIQGSALFGLQQFLSENATKAMPRRKCETVDVACQTEEKEKDCLQCRVCHEATATHAAFPCGHLCVCAGCVDDLNSSPCRCPFCHAAVGDHGFVRIYV
jgi:hypothetical protein